MRFRLLELAPIGRFVRIADDRNKLRYAVATGVFICDRVIVGVLPIDGNIGLDVLAVNVL